MSNTKQYNKIVQCDKRGQIVIPKNIRKGLNIDEGAGFWVYYTKDGIFLKKIKTPEDKDIKRSIREAID